MNVCEQPCMNFSLTHLPFARSCKIANTDSGIQRNSCAKPVKIDAELSGDMSQIWDVSFNDHLKSCIVVVKKNK